MIPTYGIFARRLDSPIGLYFRDAESRDEAKQYLLESGMSEEEAEKALHARALNLPSGYIDVLLHEPVE